MGLELMTGACPYLHGFAMQGFWTKVRTRGSSQDAAGLLSSGPRALARRRSLLGHGKGVGQHRFREKQVSFCGLVVCLLHIRTLCFSCSGLILELQVVLGWSNGRA